MDEFIITLSDLNKLEKLVDQLDGDMQQAFNKILNHLPNNVELSRTPIDVSCPPDKILVNRVEWEAVLQDLNKYRREEIEE